MTNIENNEQGVIEYFKNLVLEIKNANLDEEKAENYLSILYNNAINGIPHLSVPIDKLVEDYTNKYKSKKRAIDELIKNQILKCTTSGFVTGLGGLLSMPITLPANICSVLYVQLRMVAAIAKINGYDINSDQVRTFCYVCLAGSGITDIVKNTGIQIGKKVSENLIKKTISGQTLRIINQKVGFRLLTKFGEKGIINLVKLVPFVGGIIGGAVDNYATKEIAKRACKTFKLQKGKTNVHTKIQS